MNLSIEEITSDFNVKYLEEKDIEEILNLCKDNRTYYKYMKMEPTVENITEDFHELPPNKNMEDKFFIGFYKEKQLIAILDFVVEYPNADTVFIGWFMLQTEFQKKGIGTELIRNLIIFFKDLNFCYVQLGYMKGNQQSETFWLKNKFIPTGKETESDSGTVVVMQREI